MVIHTGVSAALYCPACGSVHVAQLDRFMPVSAAWQQVRCECGETTAYVRHGNRGIWLMRIPCVLCNQTHLVILEEHRLQHQSAVERIFCSSCAVELGFYGSPEAVREHIRRQKQAYAGLLGEGEDYSNPQILLAAYNRVHDMIAAGQIRCSCGEQDLIVQLLSGALVISCRHCGRSFQIAAANERDVSSLRKDHSIVLTTAGMPG